MNVRTGVLPRCMKVFGRLAIVSDIPRAPPKQARGQLEIKGISFYLITANETTVTTEATPNQPDLH